MLRICAHSRHCACLQGLAPNERNGGSPKLGTISTCFSQVWAFHVLLFPQKSSKLVIFCGCAVLPAHQWKTSATSRATKSLLLLVDDRRLCIRHSVLCFSQNRLALFSSWPVHTGTKSIFPFPLCCLRGLKPPQEVSHCGFFHKTYRQTRKNIISQAPAESTVALGTV